MKIRKYYVSEGNENIIWNISEIHILSSRYRRPQPCFFRHLSFITFSRLNGIFEESHLRALLRKKKANWTVPALSHPHSLILKNAAVLVENISLKSSFIFSGLFSNYRRASSSNKKGLGYEDRELNLRIALYANKLSPIVSSVPVPIPGSAETDVEQIKINL